MKMTMGILAAVVSGQSMTWTVKPFVSGRSLMDIEVGGGIWGSISALGVGTAIHYSNDPYGPWSDATGTDSRVKCLAYFNSAMIALSVDASGVNADSTRVYRSTDGVSYSQQFIDQNNTSVDKLAVGAGLIVGIGRSGVSGQSPTNVCLLRSANGTSWSISKTSFDGITRGIVFDGSTFFVLLNTGYVYTSSDGTSLTRIDASFTSTAQQAIVYGDGVLITVGNSGSIRRSIDSGASWSDISSGVSVQLASAAYGDGVFVVGGASGTLLASTDMGLTWEPATSGTTISISAVVFKDGKFFAQHAAGNVLVGEM